MECKYAEYVSYYKNYHSELRPDINTMREKSRKTGVLLRRCEQIYNIKRWMCAGVILIGTVLTAILTKSWYVVTGAILFAFFGWLSEK